MLGSGKSAMNRAEVGFVSGAVRETDERDQCPKENESSMQKDGVTTGWMSETEA